MLGWPAAFRALWSVSCPPYELHGWRLCLLCAAGAIQRDSGAKQAIFPRAARGCWGGVGLSECSVLARDILHVNSAFSHAGVERQHVFADRGCRCG